MLTPRGAFIAPAAWMHTQGSSRRTQHEPRSNVEVAEYYSHGSHLSHRKIDEDKGDPAKKIHPDKTARPTVDESHGCATTDTQ